MIVEPFKDLDRVGEDCSGNAKAFGLRRIWIDPSQPATSRVAASFDGPLIALLGDRTPDERMGRAMGTNNVFGDLGGGLGPVVSLPLIDVIGFAPVYAACTIIPIISGLTLVWGVRLERDRRSALITSSADN